MVPEGIALFAIMPSIIGVVSKWWQPRGGLVLRPRNVTAGQMVLKAQFLKRLLILIVVFQHFKA
jgi:hypothetical protein